jgi:heat shock protein HslJ
MLHPLTRFLWCAMLGLSPQLAAQTTALSKDWQLQWTRAHPPLTTTETPSLKFDRAGDRVSGFAGCNQFFGSFKATAKTLKFDQIGASKRGCAVGMAQESAYLKGLRETSGYRVDSGRLTLLDADGKAWAQFDAISLATTAAATPSKGAGWSSKTIHYVCQDQTPLEVSFVDVDKQRFASLSYKDRLSILEWQVRESGGVFVAIDPRVKLEFDPQLGTLSFAPTATAARAVVLLRDCKPE